MSIQLDFRAASCSQEEVAGFAAISAGLVPPKRLPEFVPAGVPVTAGVVLPVVLGAVEPPNKLAPGAPPETVLLELPVPEPKIPPPVAAGLAAGNPNAGPGI
jgi:hypothetical protein